MKINFPTIWQIIISYLRLDRLSWIFIILSVIINIILWVIWFKIHYSQLSIVYATTVLVVNSFLAIIFDSRGKIITYSLLITALFCQILMAILLYNSIYF